MDNELKVKYVDFKSKYKVIPIEMIVEGNKIKYNRAKKKAEDIELTRDYVGEER